MTTAAELRPRVTIPEYLAREAEASTKHILWDGEVFSVEAMSGGTLDHNTLCANVIVALGTALRGARGRVVSSDQKLWIPHTWLLHPYRAGETLQLRGPDLALPVDELYRMAFDDGAA